MPNQNMNHMPGNMDALLKAVSAKLKIPPQTLKAQLESGQFDQAIKGMSRDQQQAFQQVVSNPQILEKFMSTPQVQSLYNKLSKK